MTQGSEELQHRTHRRDHGEDAEVQIGKLTAELPKAKNQHDAIRNGADSTKSEALKEIGIKQDTAERDERLAKHPEAVQLAKIKTKGQIRQL